MKAIITKEEAAVEQVRVDLAWELFYPGSSGKLPDAGSPNHYAFANWLWTTLSMRSGFMRKDTADEISVRIPELDEAALKFLVRILSMWSDEVFMIDHGKKSGNLWTFPVSSLTSNESLDAAEERFSVTENDARFRSLMPLLGPGRVFATVEALEEGAVSARLHSHSALDEYYIVLEGTATLRMNGKTRTVSKGDMISKQGGPDLTSQIIADRGSPVRILDIEVWPNSSRMSKDVVFYPDHNELYLRGAGWHSVIPESASISPSDFERNYESGYARRDDGSWEPRDIPGYRKRKP